MLALFLALLTLAASACHKGREQFGIVDVYDPTFQITIEPIEQARVPVGQNQTIYVASYPEASCKLSFTYPAGGGTTTPDGLNRIVGPERTPGEGIGLAEFNWRIQVGTLPQTIAATAQCKAEGRKSVPVQATFEVIPEAAQ